MRVTRTKLGLITALGTLVVAAASAATAPGAAHADGGDPTEARERCATRLSIAILGESAAPNLMTSADPQAQVDALLGDAKFQERFARFVNAQFNDDPGQKPGEDAVYYLAKYVLQNDKPWKDLFIGAYDVDYQTPGDATTPVTVKADPNGLGYFRSTPWLVRYAGNEQAGYKLNTAYHMLNNTLGMELVASTNAPGADVSATGRQAQPCRQCHYDPWYALDGLAKTLTRVHYDSKGNATFTPPTDGPQQILGGLTISDDKGLVNALIGNDAFNFNVCRTAFKFLYGRAENKCEGPIFDKCMQAFKTDGMVQSALKAVAKDPSFCQ